MTKQKRDKLVTFLTSQLILKASESKLMQYYLSSDSKNSALTNNTLAVAQDLPVLPCISDKSSSVKMGSNSNSLQTCLFLSQKSSLTVAHPGKWLNNIWVEKKIFLIIFLYFKIIF